jgi:acyl-coenzyme A synthetase/AMP-(fatty) acid ligase
LTGRARGSAETIPALWRGAVGRFPDRPLMVSDVDDGVVTYAEGGALVEAAASRLARAGVRPGDRIVVVAPFHPEAIVLLWAAAVAGAVFVPLDHRLSGSSLRAILESVGPRLLFADAAGAAILPPSPGAPTILLDDFGDAPELPGIRFSEWLREGTQAASRFPDPDPESPAAILFTSGTSGAPKGVVLSHGALCRSGALMAGTYGWRPDDVLLSLGDLRTVSGFRNPCLAALHAGCSFVVSPDPARSGVVPIARCIERHGVTLLSTVPALLRQFCLFAERIPPISGRRLRAVYCSGSALPASLSNEFTARYGVPVFNYYGLTETTGLCAGDLPDAKVDGGPDGSVGFPIGARFRIADTSGETLPDGRVGELWIRSDNLMSGYHRDEPRTREAIRDGWFRTGDLARILPGGQVVLSERIDDALKDARGEYLYPSEIESALERHPGVAEAGVRGRVEPTGEIVLTAFVVPAGGRTGDEAMIAELRSHVASVLDARRTPSRLLFTSRLPRGTGGKLLRKRLQEREENDRAANSD